MDKSIFDFITSLLTRWEHPPFFVPALKAGTKKRFAAQAPMQNHQWVKLVRQMALEIGVPEEETSSLSYNSMHRFLPT